MVHIVDVVIEEFKHPFKDPRAYRNINFINQKMKEKEL